MLSAVVTCVGQDGEDLVGPDASQGPDGVQDLQLHFANLSGEVAQVTVQAPGGFRWATQPDPSGIALAEYFPASSPGQGDLYFNPQVKSDQTAAGGPLPLGGSTGSLIRLANGIDLTVTIAYQSLATADTAQVPVSNLVSPTAPVASLPVPGNVVAGFQVAVDGQDQTGQLYEQGFVHLVTTAPRAFRSTPRRSDSPRGRSVTRPAWPGTARMRPWGTITCMRRCGQARPTLSTYTLRQCATRRRRPARPRPRCCCESRSQPTPPCTRPHLSEPTGI